MFSLLTQGLHFFLHLISVGNSPFPSLLYSSHPLPLIFMNSRASEFVCHLLSSYQHLNPFLDAKTSFTI